MVVLGAARTIEDARALLGGPAQWANLVLAPLTSAAVTALAMGALLLITQPSPGTRGKLDRGPWTAKAAAWFPARRAVLAARVMTTATAFAFGFMAAGPVGRTPDIVLALACAMVAWTVATCFTRAVGRASRGPRAPLRALWSRVLTPVVFAAAASGPGFVVASLADGVVGGLAVTAVVVAELVWMAKKGGVVLGRALGLLRPWPASADDALEAAVRDTGIRPAHAWEARITRANAAALLPARSVLVTTPLLDLLDEDELSAVLRHELGHLRITSRQSLALYSPWLTLVTVAGLLAPTVLLPTIGGLGTVLVVVASFVASTRVAVRTRRRMERDADAVALDTGDKATYARALVRMYERELLPTGRLRAGPHPSLDDRLVAAGLPPFGGPPPDHRRRRVGIAVAAGGSVLVSALLTGGAGLPPTLDVWMSGGHGSPLERLAVERAQHGRVHDAVTLALAAVDSGDLRDRAESVRRWANDLQATLPLVDGASAPFVERDPLAPVGQLVGTSPARPAPGTVPAATTPP